MRLFIALPIPKSVKKQLAELQQSIKGVRWQQQGQIHLTLKFLGNTGQERARELQKSLDKIKYQAFHIDLEGFGYFPSGKQPKVLWAGIGAGESLFELQNTIEDTCTSVGFDAETRPFKPHITLARVKGGSKGDIISFINKHKQFYIPDIPINEFVLYESKLYPDGVVHNRLSTFPLEDDD